MATLETLTLQDWMQVLRGAYSENDKAFRSNSKLLPYDSDYFIITRILAGAAIGEISTVVYYNGGAGGDIVATITLTYDVAGDLETATVA